MTALPEFRWILAGLGGVLILGICWWGARRAGHSAGRPELRDPTVSLPDAPPSGGGFEPRDFPTEPREWGVPPFEPLSIRTAEFEQVAVMDLPVMTSEDMLQATQPSSVPAADPPSATTAATAVRPGIPASPPPHPAASSGGEMQHIVTLRVCAFEAARWSGAALLSAFEQHGLTHGRYQVFHRKHSDGRTLFCAASLVEPGVFDLARMAQESYRGLSLFAVLPGPLAPMQVLDVLFATAQDIAQSLGGEVQDAQGEPLSAPRAAALREDVARFQALLT